MGVVRGEAPFPVAKMSWTGLKRRRKSLETHNGAPVRTGGEDNDIKRGTLYRLTNGIVDAKPVDLASTITGSISDLKWAIGGISLYLERSFANEDAFFYDIRLDKG